MKRLLLFLLLVSKSLLVVAEMDIARVDIVAELDNAATAEIAGQVQRALQQANLGVDSALHDVEKYDSARGANTLVVAIGDGSLSWLGLKKNNFAGAIAFRANSATFNRWLPDPANNAEQRITALFRDQPLLRQLRLSKLLLPNLRNVAVLRGAQRPLPDAQALERESGLRVAEIRADDQPEWPKLLSLALRENDILLGIDDADVYNGDTIRTILLTAYRHGKGVIGPSRAFVNAGSLASCHTASDQYLPQLVDMVKLAVRERRLPRPQYPAQFGVVINRQVAASLNLSIPDEKSLSARLQNHNGECGHGC